MISLVTQSDGSARRLPVVSIAIAIAMAAMLRQRDPEDLVGGDAGYRGDRVPPEDRHLLHAVGGPEAEVEAGVLSRQVAAAGPRLTRDIAS